MKMRSTTTLLVLLAALMVTLLLVASTLSVKADFSEEELDDLLMEAVLDNLMEAHDNDGEDVEEYYDALYQSIGNLFGQQTCFGPGITFVAGRYFNDGYRGTREQCVQHCNRIRNVRSFTYIPSFGYVAGSKGMCSCCT